MSAERKALEDFARWVETWVSNPVSSYSVAALDGLFLMTRDRLAALSPEASALVVEARPLSQFRQAGQCNCADCLHIRQQADLERCRAASPPASAGVLEALAKAAQIAGDACWSRPMPHDWDRDKDAYTEWCAAQSKFVREKILTLAAPPSPAPVSGEATVRIRKVERQPLSFDDASPADLLAPATGESVTEAMVLAEFRTALRRFGGWSVLKRSDRALSQLEGLISAALTAALAAKPKGAK